MDRITRDGEVYRDGRWVGRVWRVAGGWRNDLVCDVYRNRWEAVSCLVRTVFRKVA